MEIGPRNSSSTFIDLAMLNHRGKVLVTGSHNDTRFMMRVLLEMWGYDVVEADGEEETIKAAESFLPNAILVDTSRMFDDDLKVVSRLRLSKASRLVPIIVISGFTQPKYQRAAIDHGATNLLAKPLDLDLLESCLEASLPM